MSILSKYKSLLISTLLVLVFFLFSSCTQNLYAHVDNFTVSLVTNGFYGNNNYCQYLHPFLCLLIKCLSNLFPGADSYLLLSHFMTFISITALINQFIIQFDSKRKQIMSVLLTISVLYVVSIWNCNYTVQASLYTVSGFIVLFSNSVSKKLSKMIFGTILVCVGFMWREEGALLSVPFVMLEILTTIYNVENRRIDLSRVKMIIPCVLFVIVLFSIQGVINNSDKYKDSFAYDKARVVIQDYPTLSFESIADEVDFSEFEFKASKSWVLFDTETLDTELLKTISELTKTSKYQYTIDGIFGAIKEMSIFIWNNKSWTLCSFSVIVIELLIILFSTNQKIRVYENILTILGAFIILLYFTMKGRANFQVWVSVLFNIFMIIILSVPKLVNKDYRVFYLGLCLVMLVSVFYQVRTIDVHAPYLAINSQKNNYVHKLSKTYIDNDSLYIWGSWHKYITQPFMRLGKLPEKDFIKHNIPLGDWVYGQVYFSELLADINAKNPAKALLQRGKTYYVDEDYNFVLEYLEEIYNVDILVEQVDSINDVPVWEFSIAH